MSRRYYKRKKYASSEYSIGSLMVMFIFICANKLGWSVNQIVYISITIFIVLIMLYIYKAVKKKNRYLNSGIREIDKMSGEQFENCLKYHFQKLGYRADTTAKSHDYGADLIMKKDGEKIIVQAKRYTGTIGIKAVQEAIGAMAYYKAVRGFVVSNSYFTKSASNLAEKCGIELWDRKTIIDQFDIKDIINTQPVNLLNNNETCLNQLEKKVIINNCPFCGNVLVKRNGTNGSFYGCSNYPKCKYTKNI